MVGSTFERNGGYTSTTVPFVVNGHGIYVATASVLSTTITGNTLTKNGNAGSGTTPPSTPTATYGAGICIEDGVNNVLATGNNTLGNLFSLGGVYGNGVQLNPTGGTPTGTPRLLSVGTSSKLNL